MTSDEFGSRYKLLKQMAVTDGRSYTAEHLSSGRAVLVHILEESRVGGSGGLQALLQGLNPRDRSRVLDTMTVDGSLVVVTQFLQGFDGFESWLLARVGQESPQPPAAAPGQPPELHGEFTRLFRSGADDPAPPLLQPPGLPAGGPLDSVTPGSSQFTDLFRTPAAPSREQPDPATIPPVRMVGVRVPLASEPPLRPPPLPRTEAPGPPVPPKLSPNFDTGVAAATPSDLAGWPRPDEVVIRVDDPAPPLPSPSWQGASEYTRVFGSPPQPTGELAVPPDLTSSQEPPQEKVERKRSYVPLFVILNVVLILATGLVVYFALRRC